MMAIQGHETKITLFEVIVIDPHGLGRDQPTVGFGFRMMQNHGGLPEPTLSNWLTKESGFEGDSNNNVLSLKPLSGNRFRVIQILGRVKVGGWSRTINFQLMRLTSDRCSTPAGPS